MWRQKYGNRSHYATGSAHCTWNDILRIQANFAG